MSIVNKAVKESKDVARLAVDAAKNELIEQLTPTIQRIIDGQMRAGTLGEDLDRIRRHEDGHDDDFEEGKDNMKGNMESVSALFPGVNEVADDMDESSIEESGQTYEGDDNMDEAADVEDMDEELEISESELEEMYAEALQLEVEVKKGFSDMAKPHELGAGAKYDSTREPASLADLKSGEHPWENEVPPAKHDFTVKEIRALVKQGMVENRSLANQNYKLTEMVKAMHGKLKEMNLLNSKILHVNRFMTAHRLTKEQKKSVIESIDKGATVSEVKRIFGILESSFRAAGAVNESAARRPRGDSQKRRTSGAPDAKVLRESADRAEGGGGFNRWTQLAGLKKIVG
jgi:hypothetical protein